MIEQHQIAAILTHFDETIAAAYANVAAMKALKMINEMLRPGN
jgi:restriction endonuclease S subunit